MTIFDAHVGKKTFKNIVGKGENASQPAFSPIPTLFSSPCKTNLNLNKILCHLEMLSIWIGLNILSSGKGLRPSIHAQSFLIGKQVLEIEI